MLKRRVVSVSAAFALLAGVCVFSAQPASADHAGGQTVGLHNTEAQQEECPEAVVGEAWHFVAPPKSKTDFIRIDLLVGGTWYPDVAFQSIPLDGDAYVAVPAGKALADLQGGEFHITDTSGRFNNVRLSHTCGGNGEPGRPEVEVSKSVDVTYDEEYDWTVDKRLVRVVPHTTSADLYYVIDVTRTGPTPVPGSYEVTGTITIENLDPPTGSSVEITDLTDALPGATCALNDPFVPFTLDPGDSVDFGYTCDGIDGVPVGEARNTATASVTFGAQEYEVEGSKDFDWGDATVGDTIDETATLTDDNLPGEEWFFEDSGSTDEYVKEGVRAGGSNCDPGFTNTATITEDDSGETDEDSVTVRLCTTTGGHTIGYWFNAPAGNALTLARFPTLKGQYGNVLGSLTLNTSKKIKDFGNNANCSGTCTTMLQAQFIATAMSVDQSGASFSAQCIYVPTWISASGQITIAGLLTWINANYASLDTPTRIAVKDILDAINNNATLACIV